MSSELRTTSSDSEVPSEPESDRAIARHQLRRAAAFVDIDPDVVERLADPKAVHEVTVPVEHDDGTVET